MINNHRLPVFVYYYASVLRVVFPVAKPFLKRWSSSSAPVLKNTGVRDGVQVFRKLYFFQLPAFVKRPHADGKHGIREVYFLQIVVLGKCKRRNFHGALRDMISFVRPPRRIQYEGFPVVAVQYAVPRSVKFMGLAKCDGFQRVPRPQYGRLQCGGRRRDSQAFAKSAKVTAFQNLFGRRYG